MLILWKGMKVTFAFFLLVGLTLISGLLTVLLFDKFTSRLNAGTLLEASSQPQSTAIQEAKPVTATPAKTVVTPLPKAAILNAPLIKQNPELPSGCEVTSLTMLLQFAGVDKSKVELAAEMPKDKTPLRLDKNGGIAFWGNPNIGFVGDVTGRSRGFGIYHAGLLPLMQKYVRGAADLTGKSFDNLERQIANGFPVIVWSTIDFSVPADWVSWDSSIGPVQTTFNEHAILMVGYDESAVYINDPLSGVKNERIEKGQFVEAWKAMGAQALSYTQKGG